jgi:hypothetical protein
MSLALLLLALTSTPLWAQQQPSQTSLSDAATKAASTLTPEQKQAMQKMSANPDAAANNPAAVKEMTSSAADQINQFQKLTAHITPDEVLTPEQIKIFYELDSTTTPSRALIEKAIHSITGKQWGLIHQFFPGFKITPELTNKIVEVIQNVYRIAYNDKLPVMERANQLKAIASQYIDLSKIKIQRTICIFDPIGRSGPIFQAALDEKPLADSFGVNLNMVPYTDESIAVADLKAGHCDAALISGMRARVFNVFTGTTDAIGAITTDQEMHTLLYVLSRPALAQYMVQGPFVTLGIAQGGAAYVFVDDRRINTLGKAAGKKVAVLGYDPVQAEMVARIGATPVPSSMISAPNKFNNHVVDVLPAPLIAYNALELYKGMTPNGGIIDYPLAQITMQLIGWRFKIPNVIGQLTREIFFQNYNRIQTALGSETKNIPKHWWIEIPAKDKQEYQVMMEQARLALKDKGYYSAKMLSIEQKIRCKYNPDNSECTSQQE